MCRQKKESFERKNREELIKSRTDNNQFWKIIKKLKGKKSKETDISCDEWNNHFKNLLYDDGIVDLTDEEIALQLEKESIDVGNEYDYFFDVPFTLDELLSSVNALKLGTSGGPDGTLSEVIKSTINIIGPVLLPFYNRILRTGLFPQSFGKRIMCPLYKSGSLKDQNSFRGISLIDVLNKILTGMIHERIYKWAEENNKIEESQSDFRKGYSTIDDLFVLMSLGQKYLSKKGADFTVYLLISRKPLIKLII